MIPLARVHPLAIATLIAGCSVLGALGAGRIAGSGTVPRSSSVGAGIEPASAKRGRQFFVQSCAHCHGDDARGAGEDGDGPNLFDLGIGDARIGAVILTGIPDEMPAFAKKYGPRAIADLTTYLRTLR